MTSLPSGRRLRTTANRSASSLVDEIQKVRPGETVPVEIEILPTSAIFEPGHRLVIEVGAKDDPRSFFQHDDPRDRIERGNVTVHTGGTFDSHVLLPVIPPLA